MTHGPRHRIVTMTIPLYVTMTLLGVVTVSADASDRPNVLLILADDLGYGDLGCFGNTSTRTPHLDRLASQGVKLTHSVAAATVCTPSRAAFMTGRYSVRSGMASPHSMRVFPTTAAASGLPVTELTIGDVAKKAGYRTAYLGKWHLGWSLDRSDPDHPHPLNQGFDYFYGLPLSNTPDFGDPPLHIFPAAYPDLPFGLVLTATLILTSTACLVSVGYLPLWLGAVVVFVACFVSGTTLFLMYNMKLLNSFVFRNYDIAEQPIHLPSVTRKLVAESEEFLAARHEDQAPFLLMLSWVHMHTALNTGPQFRGKSRFGPYGDALAEMDWGTGQVMDMLERYGLDHNTLVYFTSDHGAEPGDKDPLGRVVGGFNGPFAGGKGDGSTEGSYRVPALVRWPGHIPAGAVVSEPVSLMDVLPTVAQLLRVPLDSHLDVSEGRVLDGRSLMPLLTGEGEGEPDRFLFHYCQDSVHAVTHYDRSGGHIWKLMLREPDPTVRSVLRKCDSALTLDPPALYDLSTDPIALMPLSAADYTSQVAAVLQALTRHQSSLRPVPSQFAWWRLMWRPWNQPCCQFPRCACQDDKFKGRFAE